jgi:hypothetical protein
VGAVIAGSRFIIRTRPRGVLRAGLAASALGLSRLATVFIWFVRWEVVDRKTGRVVHMVPIGQQSVAKRSKAGGAS